MEPKTSLSTPVVSVIIAIYNRLDFIRSALQSIAAQTYRDYEVIIVDDGSETDVYGTIQDLLDEQARFVRLEQNVGKSVATNHVLPLAQGRYIAFLDDDDLFPPNFLEVVVATLDAAPPTVGFLLPALQMVRVTAAGTEAMQLYTFGRTEAAVEPGANFRLSPFGAASGMVLTRACVEKVGEFDPSLRTAEDIDYLIRASLHFDFMMLPKLVLTMRNHDGPQLTKPSLLLAANAVRLTEKHRAVLPVSAVVMRYRNTARLYYRLGDRAQGRQSMRKALQLRPAAPKLWVWWAAFELADYLPKRLSQRIFRSARHG